MDLKNNFDDLYEERKIYLQKIVNSLVIQNLIAGNIPKIKPGTQMSIENLTKLLKFLENKKLKLLDINYQKEIEINPKHKNINEF